MRYRDQKLYIYNPSGIFSSLRLLVGFFLSDFCGFFRSVCKLFKIYLEILYVNF